MLYLEEVILGGVVPASPDAGLSYLLVEYMANTNGAWTCTRHPLENDNLCGIQSHTFCRAAEVQKDGHTCVVGAFLH